MRTFHWYRGLIGGAALFALAAQAGRAEESAHQVNSPPAPTLQPATNVSTSTRWAGYGVVNKVTGSFRSVFGSQWNVPVVRYVSYPQSPNAPYELVSVWTGIGGNNPDLSPLIQAGTTSQVDQSGNTVYGAWYELVPQGGGGAATPLTNCVNRDTNAVVATCPVSASDRMSVEIDCQSGMEPCPTWEIAVSNLTQRWDFYLGGIAFMANENAAEWIVEAPQNSATGVNYPLPDFGRLEFSDATVNGGRALNLLTSAGVQLLDPSGGIATPCAVSNSPYSDSFMVVAYGPTCKSSFVYPAGTHDFSGDGKSDMPWQDTNGNFSVWMMNGGTVTSSGFIGNVSTNWHVVGQRDFNGDGRSDILWRDATSGNTSIWFMNGATISASAGLGNVPSNWSVYGTGDYNGDSMGDILWRDSNTGTVAIWFMNGATVASTTSFGAVPSNWVIAASDGNGNIFWRDTNSGNLAIWQVAAGQVAQSAGLGNVPSNWVIAGVGDFNGDGYNDILWRDSNTGTVAIWFMNGVAVSSFAGLGTVPAAWSIAATGDYNGDGFSDILWRDTSGNTALWFMNGATVASSAGLGNIPTVWTVQSVNAE